MLSLFLPAAALIAFQQKKGSNKHQKDHYENDYAYDDHRIIIIHIIYVIILMY